MARSAIVGGHVSAACYRACMSRRRSEKNDDLQAWGEFVAELPEVEAVIAYRKSLPEAMPTEEKRELVLERAREAGIAPGGDKILGGPDIPTWLLDTPVVDIARTVVEALAPAFGSMTLRDLALKGSEDGGCNDVLWDWVQQTHETGKPAPYPELLKGAVLPVEIPALSDDEDSMPLIMAFITPYTRMDELQRQVSEVSREHFDGYPNPDPGTLSELALVWHWKKKGKTLPQIAWRLLEGKHPEIRALSDAEREVDYKPDHKKEMDRLRQVFHRLGP